MNNRQQVTPSPSRPSSRRTATGGPTPSTVERDQAMRDYKLSIEYKHLKQHCPGGVYLVPSFEDLRLFHGAIFVRRGAFMNGIFRFTLTCPPRYNDFGSHPILRFSSYVYNPHVHPGKRKAKIIMLFLFRNRHFLINCV